MARDFTTAVAIDKQVMVGKGVGSSSSVYACYIPLSKATRETAVTNLKVRSLSFDANGVPTPSSACDAAGSNWTTLACYVCIPE